jgi:hypothetical protein
MRQDAGRPIDDGMVSIQGNIPKQHKKTSLALSSGRAFFCTELLFYYTCQGREAGGEERMGVPFISERFITRGSIPFSIRCLTFPPILTTCGGW